MADGERKSIEEIEVGDEVIATDPETGQSQAKTVLATITSKGDKNLIKVTVDTDGKRGDNTGLVIATDQHPFWVAGDLNKWINAADLKPGMWLRTSAGTYVQTTAISTWTRHQQVHNLSIADIHTYYVLAGNMPVLVHNSGCDHIALGRSEVVTDFSEEVGARHLMGSSDWQSKIQRAAYDGSTRFSVSLDGVEGIDSAITRGKYYDMGNSAARIGGRQASPFDWEIYILHESGALDRTTFYRGGQVVPNPFG